MRSPVAGEPGKYVSGPKKSRGLFYRVGLRVRKGSGHRGSGFTMVSESSVCLRLRLQLLSGLHDLRVFLV